MYSKELVKQALENWRLPLVEEHEHMMTTRFQLNYINITALSEDSKSIAVLLAGCFNAENEQEIGLSMKVCNELNCNLIQVKFYLDNDNDLVVSSEFFYESDEDVELLLHRSLEAVVAGKKQFQQLYGRKQAEEKLRQELDSDDTINWPTL